MTGNPSSVTGPAGAPVSFTAAASGSPTPTVQWQVSPNSGGSYFNIPNATATTYSFTPTSTQSGYMYRAGLYELSGSAVSSVATLTIGVAPTAVAPVVTTSPTNQAVTAGATAAFTSAGSGTPRRLPCSGK